MSSMLDALGQGGPPPELPLGGGDAAGPPSQIALPGRPDNPDSAKALDDAIAALDAYMRAEKDRQDLSVAAQCLAKLHGLAGGRQKEIGQAVGAGPAVRLMRRSS